VLKIIIVCFVLLAPGVLFAAGALLSGVEAPIAGFHDDSQDAHLLHEELLVRKDEYIAAADEANADLCAKTAAYGIKWGVLASIDLIAGDDKVEAVALAEALRTYVTYRYSTVVVRTYRLQASGPYRPGAAAPDLVMMLYDSDSQTVELVDIVDTYRGVFRFEYEKNTEEAVTETAEDGTVIEKTVVEKYFLRGIVYEPDFTRLKTAVAARMGDPDAVIPDSDIIFAEEYGRMLTRGAVQFYGLDAALSLAEYEGKFALYRSGEGYVWPVKGHYTVSSPFGVFRSIPSIGVRGVHTAIDIPAPIGTPVLAVTEGIIGSIYETVGGGRSLRLDASHGRSFVYKHLGCWADSYVGRRVEAGDIIARSGNTGKWTTGPHLSFEVRINGTPVCPMEYAGW
jgi:murein DD-endopeptidase MepM/ murein hydrolase activator NlpD